MKNSIFINLLLLMVVVSNENSMFSQMSGQQKRSNFTYLAKVNVGDFDGYNFKSEANGEEIIFSANDFVDLPGFFEGIAVDDLDGYIGKKLVLDFVYMQHLCEEGSYPFSCTGWVITGIHEAGTPKSNRNFNFPKVGKIIDPEGYVNVRSQMNVKSAVAGKLVPEFIDDECFYFYACPDQKWYGVDFEYNGVHLKGYIHASRVKIVTN
jgi:hypothetical protein